jgi:hypothetical protein
MKHLMQNSGQKSSAWTKQYCFVWGNDSLKGKGVRGGKLRDNNFMQE